MLIPSENEKRRKLNVTAKNKSENKSKNFKRRRRRVGSIPFLNQKHCEECHEFPVVGHLIRNQNRWPTCSLGLRKQVMAMFRTTESWKPLYTQTCRYVEMQTSSSTNSPYSSPVRWQRNVFVENAKGKISGKELRSRNAHCNQWAQRIVV